MDYKTPGVFIEEIPSFPPSVVAVQTAVPAFIGYTQRADEREIGDFEAVDQNGDAAPFEGDGLLNMKPTKIKSMLEYDRHFGKAKFQEGIRVNLNDSAVPVSAELGAMGAHNYRMHEALTMYFANGGGPCYVVSVGNHSTVTKDEVDLVKEDKIEKAMLSAGLEKVRKVDEVTLLLFPDAPGLGSADFYNLYKEALTLSAELKDRFAVIDVLRDEPADPTTTPDPTPPQSISDPIGGLRGGLTDNLKYGAAYWPWLKTTLRHRYELDNITIVQPGETESKTLENRGDLRTDEFEAQVRNMVSRIRVELPPSSSMVGIYAKIDSTRGVWKAPANVSVNNVVEPTLKITNTEQDLLNVHPTGKSVNVIRTFAGRGVLVWGARTLDGNSNDFRYVSVRRFLNMVEESVKKATLRFVFEPNDANTWTMVRGMIENFLLLQWRAGALQGAKPEQAFFVRVGIPDTMTALDVLEGRMNVEIGMAIVRPAEFIILKFSHKLPES